MSTQLPAECFLALASIIYADGRVRDNELQGFRRAASTYGLGADTITSIEKRAAEGIKLSEVELPELSKWQAALTYAFAVWIAKADGIINSEELAQLRELGDLLGLEKLRRDAARSATYDIAALPGGHRPEDYDFAALEAALEAKLPGSFRGHSA
jgi:tellurite resistance protein